MTVLIVVLCSDMNLSLFPDFSAFSVDGPCSTADVRLHGAAIRLQYGPRYSDVTGPPSISGPRFHGRLRGHEQYGPTPASVRRYGAVRTATSHGTGVQVSLADSRSTQ